MPRYKKVEGNGYLRKDLVTGAIINTNEKEMERARERKVLKRIKKAEEARMQSEVKELRSEIAELKELVKELVK